MTHEDFLRRAILLAQQNVPSGLGGPFGAIIVLDGAIVAEATNRVISANDPTAHAEIVAIRDACQKLGRYRLEECHIYSSCEPCPMCLSAIYWARLNSLWYAASREDAAGAGFDDSFLYQQISLEEGRRALPVHRLLAKEGTVPFEDWRAYESKIPY